MIYFTSDTHFFHENVISFNASRAERWSTIEEMNEALIANINETVGENDELYHLGDFSFKGTRDQAVEIRNRINCKKLHLVHGNHDKDWTQPEIAGVFIVEPWIKKLKVDGHKLILSHFPLADWASMTHGSIHLHGHIHSEDTAYNELNRSQGIYRYDVGVDANDFKPVSLEEILHWFENTEPRGRIPWEEWAALNESGNLK